jgi:hypothetical protein
MGASKNKAAPGCSAKADAREGSIIRAIERTAKAYRPRLVLRKRHGTVFGRAGEPDLFGSYHGRHFEIEVKRPGEEPTKLQRERLEEWAMSQAITGVAHSVDEFFAVLGIKERTTIYDRRSG